MEKRKIPLNTKYDYFCSYDGTVTDKNGKVIVGVKHRSWSAGRGYDGKVYRRYAFIMKDGTRKFFYGQRITCMTWHNLKQGELACHLTSDTLNNGADFVKPGTHEENQTVHRIEQGTYMNRGGGFIEPQPDIDPGF